MLTNLKLGSTSGSITLTPADSNVESNFTLPQLTTGGTAQYDIPSAYGPLTSVGDTGSGATNYGFLYNFAAATAGHTRTSLTIGSSQKSICPAGWHLPTAGDFSGLDIAFGGTGNYAENSQANIAKWQPAGPFKGSFSGYWFGAWYDDFGGQGGWGGLWSASAEPDSPSSAFYAYFGPSGVDPGGEYYERTGGIGVRCLLN